MQTFAGRPEQKTKSESKELKYGNYLTDFVYLLTGSPKMLLARIQRGSPRGTWRLPPSSSTGRVRSLVLSVTGKDFQDIPLRGIRWLLR